MGVGTVGIIIEIGPKHQAGFSTPVRNNIKIKWLDTQQVTLHNEFFIEVISATSS
tara:strand:+ start:542 stop:706 length:165 start_codon:yes stop_codon:yes gene_type:complete